MKGNTTNIPDLHLTKTDLEIKMKLTLKKIIFLIIMIFYYFFLFPYLKENDLIHGFYILELLRTWIGLFFVLFLPGIFWLSIASNEFNFIEHIFLGYSISNVQLVVISWVIYEITGNIDPSILSLLYFFNSFLFLIFLIYESTGSTSHKKEPLLSTDYWKELKPSIVIVGICFLIYILLYLSTIFPDQLYSFSIIEFASNISKSTVEELQWDQFNKYSPFSSYLGYIRGSQPAQSFLINGIATFTGITPIQAILLPTKVVLLPLGVFSFLRKFDFSQTTSVISSILFMFQNGINIIQLPLNGRENALILILAGFTLLNILLKKFNGLTLILTWFIFVIIPSWYSSLVIIPLSIFAVLVVLSTYKRIEGQTNKKLISFFFLSAYISFVISYFGPFGQGQNIFNGQFFRNYLILTILELLLSLPLPLFAIFLSCGSFFLCYFSGWVLSHLRMNIKVEPLIGIIKNYVDRIIPLFTIISAIFVIGFLILVFSGWLMDSSFRILPPTSSIPYNDIISDEPLWGNIIKIQGLFSLLIFIFGQVILLFGNNSYNTRETLALKSLSLYPIILVPLSLQFGMFADRFLFYSQFAVAISIGVLLEQNKVFFRLKDDIIRNKSFITRMNKIDLQRQINSKIILGILLSLFLLPSSLILYLKESPDQTTVTEMQAAQWFHTSPLKKPNIDVTKLYNGSELTYLRTLTVLKFASILLSRSHTNTTIYCLPENPSLLGAIYINPTNSSFLSYVFSGFDYLIYSKTMELGFKNLGPTLRGVSSNFFDILENLPLLIRIYESGDTSIYLVNSTNELRELSFQTYIDKYANMSFS